MKKAWLFVALFALAVAGSGSLLAQSTPPPLDHFRCYYQPNQNPLNIPVRLQDQFDLSLNMFENITWLTLARVCNTTEKIISGKTTPMTDPSHHLTMYQLNPQPITPRTVVVSNQFTSSTTLDVFDARFLLAPAFKCILPCPGSSGSTPPSTPPPANLDHYKCYAASGAKVSVAPTLIDEFTSEGPTILDPVLFCNPTVKVRGGTTNTIINNRDHLVCYAQTPSPFPGIPNPSNSSSPPGIFFRDQFQAINATVQKPDLFCVPSQKLSWAPVPATASASAAASKRVAGN